MLPIPPIPARPVVFDPGGDGDEGDHEQAPALSSWKELESTLGLLTQTLLHQPITCLGDDLPSLVADTLQRGRTILGEEVVYDDELFHSLNLPDFGPADYEANDAALESSPLDDIIEAALRRHRVKGLSGSPLESFLAGYPGAEAASDLLQNGARSFMTPRFNPNGGKECSLGGSYLKYRPICNDALLQLVREGKALVFSKDALQRSEALQELHLNPLVWAPTTGKVKGRTCLNLSKSTKNISQ